MRLIKLRQFHLFVGTLHAIVNPLSRFEAPSRDENFM